MNSNSLISVIYSDLLFSGRLRDQEFQSQGANRTFFYFLFSFGLGSVTQIYAALVYVF